MMRARKSGITLSGGDAEIVKGMLERGDRQHDIAAWFGVNGGRIAEIAAGDEFADVKAANTDLPPKGPYVSGKLAHKTYEHLKHIRTSLEQAIKARFRAVMLTSMTTIAGLMPLMFETSSMAFYMAPIAVTICFGLAFATLLVLIVIPALILLLETLKSRLHAFSQRLVTQARGALS